MTSIPYVDAAELRRLVPMHEAIDALERMFSADQVEVPQRSHLRVGSGDLLLMPAWGAAGVGVKLVTVNASNPAAGKALVNGVYVLFSADSLEPVLTIDGAAVTALRTPAVSAVATKHLARPDARRLVVFGAGTQARGHVEAMRAVRDIESVTFVTRSEGDPEEVARANIVCTCTTSESPLFDGGLLRPGTHVNAVGAYKPHTRELDDATMRGATVYVEDRAAALAEAGDVVGAIESGALDPATIRTLHELVTGAAPHSAEVTVFKSVGLASEDLVVATAAFEALA